MGVASIVVPGTTEWDAPDGFTETLYLSVAGALAPNGASTELEIYPHVLTEHHEGKEVAIATIEAAGDTHFGQIFRASSTDLEHVVLSLDVEGLVIHADDFDYLNQAALVAAWVPSDVANTPVTLDAAIFAEGASSMRIGISRPQSANDTVTRTLGPAEDWSAASDIRFCIRQTELPADIEITLRIGDGANTKIQAIPLQAVDTWEERVISLEGMAEEVGVTNMAAITTIQFQVTDAGAAGNVWIDDLEVLGLPGTIDIEIHEVASATPAALGAQIATDTLDLVNAVGRSYEASVEATGLTVGNYYAISVTNPSVAAAVINLRGEADDYYLSGSAWEWDGAGVLTILANADAGFFVYVRVAAWLSEVEVRFDADPGFGLLDVYVENGLEQIAHLIAHDQTAPNLTTYSYTNIRTINGRARYRAAEVPVLSKLECSITPAPDSAATAALMRCRIRHQPVTTYG